MPKTLSPKQRICRANCEVIKSAQQTAPSLGLAGEAVIVAGLVVASVAALWDFVDYAIKNGAGNPNNSQTLVPETMRKDVLNFNSESDVNPKKVPNPDGKKGGEEHQETINSEEQRLKDKRYIDIKGTNSQTGETEAVQVGKQNKNGTPVSREAKALNDIENGTGNRPTFTPYNLNPTKSVKPLF